MKKDVTELLYIPWASQSFIHSFTKRANHLHEKQTVGSAQEPSWRVTILASNRRTLLFEWKKEGSVGLEIRGAGPPGLLPWICQCFVRDKIENGAWSCYDCLSLTESTHLGEPQCVTWRKVGPTRRETLPSKKDDLARQVLLLAKPSFHFSCERFAKYDKKM